jgi:sugar O-acyltransferase (sialic acid O-acetyltransferase NeuD family)
VSAIVIIGAGGHARVLVAALLESGVTPRACLDTDRSKWSQTVLGVPVIGDDDHLPSIGGPAEVQLVNAIGFTSDPAPRRGAWERFVTAGYGFATVRASSAIVNAEALRGSGRGIQLLAGAIVQVGATIGDNSVINTGAQVDHDCRVGSHSHIAPAAVLCGGVAVGDSVLVGAGAVVKHGVSIGDGAVVAMGAIVIRDVQAGVTVAGIPAECR